MAVKKKKNGSTSFALAKRETWPLFSQEQGEVMEVVHEQVVGTDDSVFAFERLKVPTGGGTRWEVNTPDGHKLVDDLPCVILDSFNRRGYWIGSEVEGAGLSNSPPDCSSDDMITGRGRRSVEDDESSEQACLDCPLNVWGSGRNGRGKACSVKKRVFLLLPDSVYPIPLFLQVPPTSLKSFSQFARGLARFGTRLHHVTVSLSLKPDKDEGGNPFSRIEIKQLGDRMNDDQRAFMETLRAAMSPALRESATSMLRDDDDADE